MDDLVAGLAAVDSGGELAVAPAQERRVDVGPVLGGDAALASAHADLLDAVDGAEPHTEGGGEDLPGLLSPQQRRGVDVGDLAGAQPLGQVGCLALSPSGQRLARSGRAEPTADVAHALTVPYDQDRRRALHVAHVLDIIGRRRQPRYIELMSFSTRSSTLR